MIKPRKYLRHSLLRACSVVATLGLAIGLSACGTPGNKPDESQVVSYQYRPQYGFVRIENIETGAPDNTHPLTISYEALRGVLGGVKLRSLAGKDDALFTDDELTEIVPHVVLALAKVKPKEDVTFAVTGDHGVFKNFSPKTVTTGRVFVREGKINVIFGTIQIAFDQSGLQSTPLVFTPGSRRGQTFVEQTVTPESAGIRTVVSGTAGQNIIPGSGGQLVGKRADWVAFPIPASAPAPIAAPATPSSSPAPALVPIDSRYQELEQKLRVLDRLKENKVITEAEYLERRRAILEGI